MRILLSIEPFLWKAPENKLLEAVPSPPKPSQHLLLGLEDFRAEVSKR